MRALDADALVGRLAALQGAPATDHPWSSPRSWLSRARRLARTDHQRHDRSLDAVDAEGHTGGPTLIHMTRAFRVTVTLDDTAAPLPPGTPADLTIAFEELPR